MCIIIIVPHHNVTKAKITFDNGIFDGKGPNTFKVLGYLYAQGYKTRTFEEHFS
jgi:hypothetical protein